MNIHKIIKQHKKEKTTYLLMKRALKWLLSVYKLKNIKARRRNP